MSFKPGMKELQNSGWRQRWINRKLWYDMYETRWIRGIITRMKLLKWNTEMIPETRCSIIQLTNSCLTEFITFARIAFPLQNDTGELTRQWLLSLNGDWQTYLLTQSLWPPCIADADIIFLSGFFFFLLPFFPHLISAVTEWMSTILLHIVWP